MAWSSGSAATGPPYLKTIIPHGSGDFMYGMNYTGGAFCTSSTCLGLTHRARTMQSVIIRLDKLFKLLPIVQSVETATGRDVDFYREWAEHSTYDDYWKKISNFGKYRQMDLPILQVVGWPDTHAKSLFANYEGIQREGTPLAIREQKVLVGPWTHTDRPTQNVGILDTPGIRCSIFTREFPMDGPLVERH
jgi:predicted acyl esterase